jgi:hypothetical protein
LFAGSRAGLAIRGRLVYKRVMPVPRPPRPALALALAATLCAPVAIGSPRCLTPPERTAFEVRVLQTEMMVAALTCRGVGGHDFSAHYAQFVENNREALKVHAGVLRSHFRRSFGAAAETHLDRYVTSLANDLSRASMSGSGTFCPQQGALFERAARTGPGDVARFASERAAVHPPGLPVCAASSSGDAVAVQPPRR